MAISTHSHSPRHILVRFLGDGEDMRVEAAHILAHVSLDGVHIVDGEILIRIDGDKHDSTIRVDGVLIDESD